MALSHSVKQWGLLSWNKRWMTFERGTISLYKSEHGPEGDPIVAFDLAAPGCKYEVDPVNACRLSLDNSIGRWTNRQSSSLLHQRPVIGGGFDSHHLRQVTCTSRHTHGDLCSPLLLLTDNRDIIQRMNRP